MFVLDWPIFRLITGKCSFIREITGYFEAGDIQHTSFISVDSTNSACCTTTTEQKVNGSQNYSVIAYGKRLNVIKATHYAF